jgi:hypothetical protein
MSFKTYLQFSVLRAVGELMFYGGFAVVGVGIALWFAFSIFLFLIMGIVAGGVVSGTGYMIHKYGKFKENTEQIASGVSKGIHNVPNSQQAPPPPPNPCPGCGHQLTFIEQYKQWYCFNCKEYK